MQPQSVDGLKDEDLLAVARQLCDKLEVKASDLDRLMWCDYLHDVRASRRIRVRWYGGRSFGHMLSAHFPVLFDRALVLREMMKGRLDREEWEPLICSSLIFYKQLRRKRYIGRSLALLPFLALFAFTIVSGTTYSFLGYPLFPWQAYAVLLVVFLVSPFFPGLYVIRRLERQLVFEADRRTAMLLGREHLLQVLEKIDATRKSDLVQGRRDDWRDFMFVPTLTERVKHLQG